MNFHAPFLPTVPGFGHSWSSNGLGSTMHDARQRTECDIRASLQSPPAVQPQPQARQTPPNP